VKRLCQIVEINRSSFYAWQNAAPTRADRATADAELVGRIRAVHDGDNTCGAHGSPPSSTTAYPSRTASTTNASPG
jgi:hypothetical protein